MCVVNFLMTILLIEVYCWDSRWKKFRSRSSFGHITGQKIGTFLTNTFYRATSYVG